MTIRQRIATFMLVGSLFCGGAVAVDANTASAAQHKSEAVAKAPDEVATAATAALAAMGTDQFPARLDDVVVLVAIRLGAVGGRLHQAWTAADQPHQVALLSALSQVGVRYHRNASQPGVAFDCSGLTSYAWGQAGVALNRQSGSQIRSVAPRTLDTAQAGDLAYYPGHVMIWLGVDSLIVHAPQPGHDVEVGDISSRRINRTKFGNPIG